MLFSSTSGLADGISVFKNDMITTATVVGNPDKWGPAAKKTAQGLNQLKGVAMKSEKREKALGAMVKHYGNRRRQMNPFEEGSKYHEGFAVAYSGGYSSSYSSSAGSIPRWSRTSA